MHHTHATTTQDYRAFLLRLWREDANAPWRCSLQATHAGERLGFADLQQLVAYLLGQVDEAALGHPAHQNTTRDDVIVPQTDGV